MCKNIQVKGSKDKIPGFLLLNTLTLTVVAGFFPE